jgi:hypothetical protein
MSKFKQANMEFVIDPKGRIEASVEIRIRQYYASLHIRAAALFSRLTYKVEQNCSRGFNEVHYIEHRSFVTNAIFSSTAFLEAYINELFADLNDKEVRKCDSKYKALESKFNIFSEMWEAGIPRTSKYSILDKYQIALVLAEKEKLSKGSKIYQDIDVLVRLRNALIHYEPEWILGGSESEENKLSKQLKSRIKSLNPLTPIGRNPFYPDRCMSHGLTEWAVESSIKFADEFSERIGVRGSYNDCRDQLNTR